MNQKKQLRQYVLDDLPETAREDLEGRLLVDEVLSEQLDLVEDEVVEAYLRGTLPAPERARVDARQQGNPAFARRVELARILQVHFREEAPSVRWLPAWWPLALAATMAVVFVVWRGLIPTPPPPVADVDPTATVAKGLDLSETPAGTAAPEVRPTLPGARWAALSLSPGQTMGGASDSVALGPEIDELRLELALDDPIVPSYFVDLRDETGSRVMERAAVRADTQQGVLALAVPASSLQSRRYRLRVAPSPSSPPEDAVFYYFSVTGR